MPTKKTMEGSEPSLDYITKYDMVDMKDVHYRINTFKQINFPDPFPKENRYRSKCGAPKDKDD
jgi:hypothetical protein